MPQGLYFGGEISIDPHEVMMQQGVSFRSSHRELAVADNGSLDILVEVDSSCHVAFDFNATGTFLGTFVEVTSHNVSIGNASLDVWNMNTFFQAVNSGAQSTKVSHTGSYEVVANRGNFMVGGGGAKQAPLAGKEGDSMILGPGIWAFQMQNKSGGAADIQFTMTWEEPAIPNIP